MSLSSKGKTEAIEALERLAGLRRGWTGGLSPNDVLVQIALPLVLILAIATRLMTMAQVMSDRDRSATVLDLWKQQLILRMEHVLSRWERDMELATFTDASRIRWDGRWPADEAFQTLSLKSQMLAEPETLTDQLYREALQDFGVDQDGRVEGMFFPLYDPEVHGDPPSDRLLHDDEIMTPERRAFARAYLSERQATWHDHVAALQWGLVSRVVENLPPEDALSDGRLTVQMRNLALALEERGYPLLPSVAQAYGE